MKYHRHIYIKSKAAKEKVVKNYSSRYERF